MRRSMLRVSVVAALGLAGLAGCGDGSSPGDKEVVVDIGEFGELAGPPITSPTTGPTGAPTTTVLPPTNQSLADALNASDCAAIEPSNDTLRVLLRACEAGELETPEAWAEALSALRDATVDGSALDAAAQQQLLDALRPVLEQRAADGGGPIRWRVSAQVAGDGSSTTSPGASSTPGDVEGPESSTSSTTEPVVPPPTGDPSGSTTVPPSTTTP